MKIGRQFWAVLFILAFVTILTVGEQTDMFSVLGGWSTLSLDRVSYVSNDPTLNKDAFLLTISQTGQGEYASGTVYASNMQSLEGTATNDITIKSRIEDYRCQYPINYMTEKIYDYTIVDTCGKWDLFCSIGFYDRCIARGNDYYVDDSQEQSYCIQKTVIATKGLIGDAFFNFKTTFDINIGGLTESVVLTPTKTSAMSSDGRVNVAWTGNTVSGMNCPDPDRNDIGIVRYQNAWRTTDLSNLEYYSMTHKTQLDTCFNNARNEQDATICIMNANLAARSALAEKKFTFASVDAQTTAHPEAYGITGDGAVILSLNKLLQFPQYTLIVDADTLNIVKPVGMPKIVSAKGSTLMTGQTGHISTTIKNVGTGTGSFAVSVACDSPFSYTGSAYYLTLEPQEIDSRLLPIKGECNSDISKTCTVTVYDRNNPSKRDTRTVSMGCSPIVICSTGEIRCLGEIEQKCIAGTHWENTGTDNCRDIPSPPATCQVDADCDDGNFLTLDKCEGIKIAGIDTGVDKKCTHKDMTWGLLAIAGFVVFLLFAVVMVIAVSAGKSPAKVIRRR